MISGDIVVAIFWFLPRDAL